MKKINELEKFNRPREKLKEKGVQALSDTELVAILLGSGNKGQDVMTLASKVAKLISDSHGNCLLTSCARLKGLEPQKPPRYILFRISQAIYV